MITTAPHRTWKRPPFVKNPLLRWGLWLSIAIYLALAFGTMEVNWGRVAEGMTRGQLICSFLFPARFH